MAAKKKASKGAKKKKASKKKAAAQTTKVRAPASGVSLSEHYKRVRLLSADINHQAGCKVIVPANEAPNPYFLRRPSGIMPLDIDTGGGPPAGDLIYISGPQGSGKSYLAMLHAYMCQRIYGQKATIAWAPVEGGFDYERADQVGLKIARPEEMIAQEEFRLGHPLTPERLAFLREQVGIFEIIRGESGEQILQAALELIKSGLFHLVIVDSLSALLPKVDAPKELQETNKVASHASMVTDFMKRYMVVCRGLTGLNETTTIFISEVRANMAKATASPFARKFMNDWTSDFGAWSAKHTKSIEIELSEGKKLYRQQQNENILVGKQFCWGIVKGRHGTHEGKKGDVPFYYVEQMPRTRGRQQAPAIKLAAGVDVIETVIRSGMHCGVILENRGKVSAIDPETKEYLPDGEGYPSYANLAGAMRANLKLELDVRHAILKAHGISCLYYNKEDEQHVLAPYL